MERIHVSNQVSNEPEVPAYCFNCRKHSNCTKHPVGCRIIRQAKATGKIRNEESDSFIDTLGYYILFCIVVMFLVKIGADVFSWHPLLAFAICIAIDLIGVIFVCERLRRK